MSQRTPVPGISPKFAIAGGATIMVGTYFGLNALLNTSKPVVSVPGAGTIDNSSSAYLAGTYRYVGGGIGITALSAVAAFRSGLATRVLSASPIAAGIGSLVVILGGSMATMSTDAYASPVLKHGLWATTCASVGALSLSTMGFFPQALLLRAGWYTVAIVGSLSAVAINSHHDAFLYLGGPLMMGLGLVCASSLVSVFAPTGGRIFALSHGFSLYGGLAVFSLLMLYDTQQVMAKGRVLEQQKRMGYAVHPDYINESFGIYWNIINIFVRIVGILSGQSNRKK